MRKIKSYSDFIKLNEEEGWKEKVLAGTLAASSMLGGAKAATVSESPYDKQRTEITHEPVKKKDDGRTTLSDGKLQKVVRTEKEAKRLQDLKWTLDSISVDTIFDELVKSDPVDVLISELKFSERQYFPSGEYVINDEIKQGLDNTIKTLKSDGYVIMDIILESSTDKQGLTPKLKNRLETSGYKGDNSGLAKARSEAVGKYLIELGIDSSIIKSNQIVGGGSSEVDESARYVTVKFACLKEEVIEKNLANVDKKIEKKYYLSKELSSKVKIGEKRKAEKQKTATPKNRNVSSFDFCPKRGMYPNLF
jgi:outer membrane protein OmpA-like peptidoglycan-associated protein